MCVYIIKQVVNELYWLNMKFMSFVLLDFSAVVLVFWIDKKLGKLALNVTKELRNLFLRLCNLLDTSEIHSQSPEILLTQEGFTRSHFQRL